MKRFLVLPLVLLLTGCFGSKEVVYRDVYHYNIIYGFDSKITNPETGKPYKDFEVISNELNREINTNNVQAEALKVKQEAENKK